MSTTLLILTLVALCVSSANAVCPGDGAPCSGHGTCGAWDTCTCYRNWQASDCSERTCPFTKAWADTKDTSVTNREDHYYLECGGKGECDRKVGECKCFDGFSGRGCDRMGCPGDCNGHGTCDTLSSVNSGYTGWDADKIQVCTCDAGYTGPACTERMCKKGDDPMTLQTVDAYTNQEDEVQAFEFSDSGAAAITGLFTLKYTDWRGQQWTTHPIDIATATAISVEEALIALPNSAIPSVSVVVSGTGASGGDITFTVTFDDEATPGDQNELEVDYTACTTAGCQPVISGVSSANTLTVAVSTTTAGTEENVPCSGRGLCATDTGLCKCFAGYYGEACQTQTIIT